MIVSNEVLDSLLAGYQKPEDLIGENGLLKQLTKALVERALSAEMEVHLGHGKHRKVTNPSGNSRNGSSAKTLQGDFGKLPIAVPRDRQGSFEPQWVPKHQTRWAGFDEKILSLYARGMSVREIQGHLEEMYGVEVSPALISTVTDAVMDEARAWQGRPPGRCTRSSSWTASTSRSATAARSRRRRCTWRWAWIWPGTRTCSGCGWPRTRAPSSGSRW
jgi:putative transposase